MFDELIEIRNAGINFVLSAPADAANFDYDVSLQNAHGSLIAATGNLKASEVVPWLQNQIRIAFPDSDYSKLNPAPEAEETSNENDGELSNEGTEEVPA